MKLFVKNFILIFKYFITFSDDDKESGLLSMRELYRIARSSKQKVKHQSNDTSIDDEMVEPNSFTADGGGFEV